mmetsp:Transcript_10927/g.27702  ORF Transcript_10927/g.27702 Transcript_10927/m.27702 type:complete len:235 (+) Transcript_10927:1-705(+)
MPARLTQTARRQRQLRHRKALATMVQLLPRLRLRHRTHWMRQSRSSRRTRQPLGSTCGAASASLPHQNPRMVSRLRLKCVRTCWRMLLVLTFHLSRRSNASSRISTYVRASNAASCWPRVTLIATRKRACSSSHMHACCLRSRVAVMLSRRRLRASFDTHPTSTRRPSERFLARIRRRTRMPLPPSRGLQICSISPECASTTRCACSLEASAFQARRRRSAALWRCLRQDTTPA